jgi:cephalosporin-C deacetylase-like acetyl esterase
MASARDWYPTPTEVDEWCRALVRRAEGADVHAELLGDVPWSPAAGIRHASARYVAFHSSALGEWYGIYQRCPSGRGPVLVHVPGYGAEMSTHPELTADGYNVLHVSPLGYATPDGQDLSKRDGDTWPVLPDTVRTLGEGGYVDWLAQAAAAALWARTLEGVEPDRLAFFGTSQGGGTALLLGSILSEEGARAVAADVPFLTDMPWVYENKSGGAYDLIAPPLEALAKEGSDRLAAGWKALGFADTLCHAHRLTMPVLLTAGSADTICPPQTIRTLFDRLPATRAYVELGGQAHAYTVPFLTLARAWMRLYV